MGQDTDDTATYDHIRRVAQKASTALNKHRKQVGFHRGEGGLSNDNAWA